MSRMIRNPGVGEFHEKGGELLVAGRVGVGAGHHQGELGNARAAGEPLLTVQDPVVAVADGGGADPGGVGARRAFGHGEADADLAVDQGAQVALLLLVGAVLDEGEHRGVLRTHAVERPGAEVGEGAADLDLHHGVGQMAQAHAAPLLRDERAPQAFGPGLALQLGDDVEEGSGPDLGLGGQDVRVDERGGLRAYGLYVGGQLEVDHVVVPLSSSGGRSRRRRGRAHR
jgi:hypothetical protein